LTDSDVNELPAAPLGRDVRQKTIDVLCESFARDEMDVEEFEQRVELVERATTMEHLRTIVADIPTQLVPGESQVAARHTLPADQIPEHSVIAGIMGGGQRSGAWVPAKRNWAVGVMGGCELDFREAQLGPGVTEITAFALMGGVQVLVPPNVRVECSGIGIMGAFEHKPTVISTVDPDAPIIRVNGVAIMGGVEVTVRHAGESARDVRRRLKAERKAQRRIARGE